MANVTVIPATRKMYSSAPATGGEKRRVAAYARVSTDTEEQAASYEAQVEYYTNYIQNKPEWTYVKVYTDEGISGTNTKNRKGFNEMMDDALAGKIDLIITKSISRFARNTVDTLTAVRKLKEKGCEVWFEKENIQTFDSKGELLITIMSSLAQEESRSISENVTWGHRKRFADGKMIMAYSTFLGYKRGENGEPKIVEEEAEIVRMIYRMFMEGKTYSFIAKYLTELKIPTPHKKEVWRPKAVQSILTNEKYKGSAILQKTFTVDFLQKKVKKNEGEVAKYYVEKSHPAIISPEEWEKVQTEVEYRKLRGNHYNSLNPFCFKIVCGECGDHYGKKVWHSTDPKYRKSVWHCNSKYLRETGCSTPFITDEDIKILFIRAVRKLSVDDGTVLETCMLAKETLADASAEEERGRELADKLEMLNLMITNLIKENAAEPMDQAEYNRKYNLLSGQYEEAQFEYNSLCEKILEKRSKADRIDTFIEQIKSMQNMPLVYSDKMFINMVDEVVVTADESLIFKFKNGAEIEELLD